MSDGAGLDMSREDQLRRAHRLCGEALDAARRGDDDATFDAVDAAVAILQDLWTDLNVRGE